MIWEKQGFKEAIPGSSFGLVTDSSVAGDEPMDTLVLFKPFDELKVQSDAPWVVKKKPVLSQTF